MDMHTLHPRVVVYGPSRTHLLWVARFVNDIVVDHRNELILTIMKGICDDSPQPHAMMIVRPFLHPHEHDEYLSDIALLWKRMFEDNRVMVVHERDPKIAADREALKVINELLNTFGAHRVLNRRYALHVLRHAVSFPQGTIVS